MDQGPQFGSQRSLGEPLPWWVSRAKPPLYSPRGPISPWQSPASPPHPGRQTRTHRPHTDAQTHTSDAQLATPTPAPLQPQGVPPALRLQGQGPPDCSSQPSVFPTGPWARATVRVPAGQHTGKGSLTPRRWVVTPGDAPLALPSPGPQDVTAGHLSSAAQPRGRVAGWRQKKQPPWGAGTAATALPAA